MKIEWWMLDGLVGLVVLISALRGIAKGIGDTLLRLIGLAGGLILGVMYSGKVSAYLATTRFSDKLHDQIYEVLRPGTEEAINAAAGDAAGQAAQQTAGGSGGLMVNITDPTADPIADSLPKAISGLINGIADKSAEAVSDRLTEIAISIFSFVIILIAVWLLMSLIRLLFRHGRDDLPFIGFVDRLLGFVLGIVKGLILACIVIAAVVPLTTFFAPEKVPEMIAAMRQTYVAGIIYDINPFMMLIEYILG